MKTLFKMAAGTALSFLLLSPRLHGQTVLFSEDFETQFVPNTAAGPNAPAGWTQLRTGYGSGAPSAPGTDGNKDWALMQWSGTSWLSNTLPNVNQSPYPSNIAPAPATGTGAAWYNGPNTCASSQNNMLVSPIVDLSSTTISIVQFDHYHASVWYAYNYVDVFASNDGIHFTPIGYSVSSSSGSWKTLSMVIPPEFHTTTARIAISVSRNCSTTGDVWLDNFRVIDKTTPATITATTTGGNWGSSSTWVGGVIPGLGDHVIIPASSTVLVNGSYIVTSNLTLSGTLNFGVTSYQISVLGNLTINSGGVFNPYYTSTSYTTGRSIILYGNFTNNGTATLYNYDTKLALRGIVAQSISGSGSFNNASGGLYNLEIDNTSSSGVTLSAALTVKNMVELIRGNLSVSTNLTLSNPGWSVDLNRYQGSLTGTLSVNATTQYDLSYKSSSSLVNLGVTVGNELPPGGSVYSLSLTNPGGVTSNTNITVTSSSNSAVYLDGSILTLTGTNSIKLSNVGGGYSGYGSGCIKGKCSATLNSSTPANMSFPVGDENGRRTVTINGWSNGGTGNTIITVEMLPGAGNTAGTGINAISTARRYHISRSGVSGVTFGTIGFSYDINDSILVSPLGDRTVGKSGLAAGPYTNFSTATNSSSTTITSDVPTAFDINPDAWFALGLKTETLPVYWIGGVSGDWNTGSNWSGGAVPVAASNVQISGAVAVSINTPSPSYAAGMMYLGQNASLTLNSNSTLSLGKDLMLYGTLNIPNAATATGTINIAGTGSGKGLDINPGASLNIENGILNISSNGTNNRTLFVRGLGSLFISGGTLAIYGNFKADGFATVNQTGGNIIVDGNSGTASTSVPSGVNHVYLYPYSDLTTGVNTFSFTGGKITIVDPPHSSYASGTSRSFTIYSNYIRNAKSIFSGSHTIEFGDGISSTTGCPNGFAIETQNYGAYPIPLNNVVIKNAAGGSYRFVSGSFTSTGGTHIQGTLTIEAGGSFRASSTTSASASKIVIGGNILGDGNFIANKMITFGGDSTSLNYGYTISTPQTIGGAVVFSNSPSGASACIEELTIDNAGGVTIANSNVIAHPVSTFGGSIKGILNLQNGNLYYGGSTPLCLGISAAFPGTLQYTSGNIVPTGTAGFKRWLTTTTMVKADGDRGHFPLATPSGATRHLYVTGTLTGSGSMEVIHAASNASTSLTPFTENSGALTVNKRNNSSWQVSFPNPVAASSGLGLTIKAGEIAGVTDYSQLVPTLATAAAPGTYAASWGTNTLFEVNRTGLTSANLANTFYIGGNASSNTLPVTLTSFTVTTTACVPVLSWTTASELNTDYFAVEYSTNNTDFRELARVAGKGSSQATQRYSYTAAQQQAGYYRLKMADQDGRFAYSETRFGSCANAMTGISISPNPAAQWLNINTNEAIASYHVYDMQGREIITLPSMENNTIDISSLVPGMYFISVHTAGQKTAQSTFIKQ